MKPGEAEAIFPYASLPKVAVSCPGCGAENASRWVHDRYGYAVPFANCKTCALRYLAEQLTREGYDQLYAGKYRELVSAYNKRPNETRQKTNGFWRDVLRLASVKKLQSILDAGGSTGIIGQNIAQAYGATLTILDPAAQEFPAGPHLQGYLEDPIPGTYDLALCVETVDHLTQPLRALTNIRAVSPLLLLNYIDVEKRENAQIKIDHPLYWNDQSMRRILQQTGWAIRFRHNGQSIQPPHEYLSTVLVCEHASGTDASGSPKDA